MINSLGGNIVKSATNHFEKVDRNDNMMIVSKKVSDDSKYRGVERR
jgi:hypothetical protein